MSARFGWTAVFSMLVAFSLVTALALLPAVRSEAAALGGDSGGGGGGGGGGVGCKGKYLLCMGVVGAMGLGNILSGLMGGMGGNAMIGLSTIACLNGGRGRVAPLATSLGVLLCVSVAYRVLNFIPMAALAGVMLVVVLHTFKWLSLPMLAAAVLGQRVGPRLLWGRNPGNCAARGRFGLCHVHGLPRRPRVL